jgi:hypothetical protein
MARKTGWEPPGRSQGQAGAGEDRPPGPASPS